MTGRVRRVDGHLGRLEAAQGNGLFNPEEHVVAGDLPSLFVQAEVMVEADCLDLATLK